MNIFAWITLLIFVVYFSLIYTASKSGWLERHNMSLAMGFIIMWRTQRGKEMIESLAGRPTKADHLRDKIRDIEADLAEEEKSLEEAHNDMRMVKVVRQYREKSNQVPLLEVQHKAAVSNGDPGADQLKERIDELRYEVRALDKRVDPKSKFRDLLREGDDAGVEEDLEEILDSAQGREEMITETMSSQRLQISDAKEEIERLERSPENEKQKRRTRRRRSFWRAYGNVAMTEYALTETNAALAAVAEGEVVKALVVPRS